VIRSDPAQDKLAVHAAAAVDDLGSLGRHSERMMTRRGANRFRGP
jgi:hypothetical protein